MEEKKTFTSQRADYDEIPSDFAATLKEIEKRRIDIAPDYNDWLRLGFALAYSFGENGRSYFHRLSQFNPDYNVKETDKQYSHCLKSKGSGVTIKTFFEYAKRSGVDLIKIAQEKIKSTKERMMREVDFRAVAPLTMKDVGKNPTNSKDLNLVSNQKKDK